MKAQRTISPLAATEPLEPRRHFSVSALVGHTIKLAGDDNPNDFVVRLDPDDSNNVQVYDGVTLSTFARGDVKQVLVTGNGGDDRLFIDNSFGFVSRPDRAPLAIRFNGGDGDNQLLITGDTGDENLAAVYTVGNAAGSGTMASRGGNGTSQRILFSNAGTILDFTPGASLTVAGNGRSNYLALTNGPAANDGSPSGQVAIQDVQVMRAAKTKKHDKAKKNKLSATPSVTSIATQTTFAAIIFSNQRTITLAGAGGDDFIDVNLPESPPALATIVADGGKGSDQLATESVASGLSALPRSIEHSGTAPVFSFTTLPSNTGNKGNKTHGDHEENEDRSDD